MDSANVIQWDTQNRPLVPDFPIIPFIEGMASVLTSGQPANPFWMQRWKESMPAKEGYPGGKFWPEKKPKPSMARRTRFRKRRFSAISFYGVAIKGPSPPLLGVDFVPLT